MKIPPRYTITSEMIQYIVHIDALKYFSSSLKIPPLLKEKIQRISYLKSSLYSARIEGNPLTYDNIHKSEEDIKKKEIYNIMSAIHHVERTIFSEKTISKQFFLQLHKKIMHDLSPDAGYFRKEMSAIFNEAGIAVYIPPPPQKISIFIQELIRYVYNTEERFPLICAIISHLIFEKIHPFIDGNGRVGRAMISAILKSKNYDFGMAIPFEEYLDNHKSEYYYYLGIGLKKPEEYILFMLKAFLNQTQHLKDQIEKEMEEKEIIFLPPRQEEILNIIKDHNLVSFDFLKRRFIKIPERTLRYDVKKLAEKELIVKIGKTKGSFYSSKKK